MSKQKKDTGEQGARPWRDTSVFAGGPGQKWTLPASIILVVLLVVIGLAVLFLPKVFPSRPAGQDASTISPTSTPKTATSNSTAPSAQDCPASPVDEGASGSPSDISWAVQYGNSWPVSASTGPTKTIDGLGRCFARSPAGAALAAVNLTQTVRTADLATAQKILDAQYVQNEGVKAAAAGIAKAYEAQPPQSRQWGRTMGFKVLAFTGDAAQILLVENWPQRGQYTGFTVNVVWSGGDWKVRLEDSGQTSSTPEITVDPNGFTRWEAAP